MTDAAETFDIAIPGAVLHGEASGAGTPLVLVHGMAGDLRDWDTLVAALPADYPVLRYDLRGFGRSSRLDGAAYSHSDDLLALLDARGIACAHVLGLSMGGGAALNFALSHPDRVSRLILVSPAMVGWRWSDEWIALWRDVSRAARAGDVDLARQCWLAHPMFAAALESDAGETLRRGVAAFHGDQWARDFQRDELPDLDRLPMLKPPTLLLTGGRDVTDMRQIADMIEGAAPTVTRIDFPDAGHMLHIERAADVATAITQRD